MTVVFAGVMLSNIAVVICNMRFSNKGICKGNHQVGGMNYYALVAYMSLDLISPLSFSIGNTMKPVTVIVSSIIDFHTQVRPINAVGVTIAILGTFLYYQGK
jgi:hypothetical protein